MPSSGGTLGTMDRLSAFVRDYLIKHDVSERALAKRAVDPESGLKLNNGWINQLVLAQVIKAPERWRLRALAVAMQVPVQMLAELAAAQWLGVDVAEVSVGGGAEWVAITVPAGLSPEKREQFVRMAEDMARHFGT